MRSKTVLVTGGAGYVGSILVPMLLENGYQVRVLDKLLFGGQGLMMCNAHPNFQFLRGDIRDAETMAKALYNIDYVIHLAAIVGYPACDRNKRLAKETNLAATEQMLELMTPEQKVILASTGSVYGKVDGICTEETPPNPLSLYAETKLAAEDDCLRRGNAIVYRFATAYGLSPRLRLDLMPNDFVYQAVKNKVLVVYEKNFRRTFVHVKDMARAFIHGIENFDAMNGQIYNIGDESQNFTKEKICAMIMNRREYYLHFADFDGDKDKRDYEVSFEKIRRTDFDTIMSMERGICELIKGIDMLDIPNPYSNNQQY